MKNEGITQGPLFAVQDTAGAWCVNVGPLQYDQMVAYFGTDNPNIQTGSAKGNAQLFAAAHKMLETLKNIQHELSIPRFNRADESDMLAEIEKQISEAEGRA